MAKIQRHPNPNGCRNWGHTIELKKNKEKTRQREKNELRRLQNSLR